MGNLLANATAVGFGTSSGVNITSKDAGFDVTGLVQGWYIEVYYSTTDDIGAAVKVVDPRDGIHRTKTIRITENGPYNFAWLPTQGYVWAYLAGGRNAVTVNMDVLFAA